MTNLNVLLQILLKTYFFNARCIFLFTDTTIDLQVETPIVCLKVNNTLNPHLIFQHHGCQDILIHHENASDIFVQFENLIKLHSERFNARRYIVTGLNSLQILLIKELEYVSDLLLVIPNSENGSEYFEMITHAYGHKNKINEAVLLDIWYSDNYTFEHGNDLFPNKLSNQNGRSFKIGTFTYEPYSITGKDDDSFHGTETSLIYEFVRKYNLTPSFTIIGDELWGDIYDNWTGIGLLGSVLDDSVDIGYAAVYTWEDYYKFMDYTKPLTRTGITCIVPAPQLAAGWFTPLRSFSLEMWIALLVVLLSDAVVLSLIFYGDHNKRFVTDSIMTLIKLYLLQSLTIPLKGKLLKYFIAMNMIMVLLISSSYSSGLSSVMTVPRYDKAIRTIKDLASSELPWGATSDAWLISLRQVDEEDYKIIKNRFVVKKEDDLTASSRLHNFGFSLERLPYGHYAVGPYIKPDIIANYRIMQEDIYWEQCIFVIRKNSVLLSLLDNLILRVFEAGLEAYWENEVVSQFMDMSVQRGIKFYTHHINEHDIVKLKWVHVEGAFAHLVLGHITSVLTFLIEFLRNNTTNERRVYVD